MKKGLRKYPVTVIVRSCLTGAPVWVYQGASKNGARQAYWRACKAEIEFVSRLPEYCAQWKAGLERFISSCMEKYPIDAKLTPEQAAAAKKLRAMLKKGPDINLDFYNHVMEERRLMYVAMTRAKERLYICSVATQHGKRPSRFVAEILKGRKYIRDTLKLIRTH